MRADSSAACACDIHASPCGAEDLAYAGLLGDLLGHLAGTADLTVGDARALLGDGQRAHRDEDDAHDEQLGREHATGEGLRARCDAAPPAPVLTVVAPPPDCAGQRCERHAAP